MRHNYATLDEARMADDPRLKYVKPSWRARWLRMTKESLSWPPGEGAARREGIRLEKRLVEMMQRAGVRILAGTDDANPCSFPGFSLHEESSMLVEAGLTPAQALRAAATNAAKFPGRLDSLGSEADIPAKAILQSMTTNAARLPGVERQRGAISAGQFADIIATPDNPLDDISTLKRVSFVMKNGKVFKPAK